MTFKKLVILVGALVIVVLVFPIFAFAMHLPLPSINLFQNIADVAIDIAVIFVVNIYLIKIHLSGSDTLGRICLDNLNAKSLDIDNRLNDRSISEEEAIAEKKALYDELTFYSRLDGYANLLKMAIMIISGIYIATLAVGTFVGTKLHEMQWYSSLVAYGNLSLPFFLLIELAVIIASVRIRAIVSKFWEK